jgi:hypothetical protein
MFGMLQSWWRRTSRSSRQRSRPSLRTVTRPTAVAAARRRVRPPQGLRELGLPVDGALAELALRRLFPGCTRSRAHRPRTREPPPAHRGLRRGADLILQGPSHHAGCDAGDGDPAARVVAARDRGSARANRRRTSCRHQARGGRGRGRLACVLPLRRRRLARDPGSSGSRRRRCICRRTHACEGEAGRQWRLRGGGSAEGHQRRRVHPPRRDLLPTTRHRRCRATNEPS